ncbi:MAG: DUF126 domain-containing protein [Chloroflexi bacterium]|nr:DUF126 domain-containing protein [Chloroflexota bacterium]
MERVISTRPLVSGSAEGILLVSVEPLSFWGGYDAQTGEIIDRRHPLSGHIAAGCILALPSSRGSSTTSAVLLEAVRLGRAPAAIITSSRDTYFALASIVAGELYDASFPVLAVPADIRQSLVSGARAVVEPEGILRVG